MKLLVLNWFDRTHPLWGGAEVYLHEVFGRLAARGHQVTLLCTRYAGCESDSIVDGIRVMRRGHFWTFHLEAPWFYRQELAGGGRADREFGKWDCIFEFTNKIPMLTPLYVRAPLVAVAHHLWGASIFQESVPPVAACVYAMERLLPFVYRRTPWISVSESTRDELAALGISRSHVRIIANGLDQDLLRAGGEEVTPEPTSATAPTIAWIGRMKRYKRVDVLLRAMPHVLRELPNATLELAGDGVEAPRLKALAASLPIPAGRIRFLGTITEDQKRALLRRASLLAQPSAKEGWGRTVLEAGAFGIPAVASNVAGLRESVRHGETGRLVPPGDPTALAAEILSLLRDKTERTRLGSAAREWAARFSWDTAAAETEAIARHASERAAPSSRPTPVLGPTAGSL